MLELTSLTLLNTVIDDEAIDCINNLKKLRSIHLESTPAITPYGYAELLRNLPELRKFNLFRIIIVNQIKLLLL